MRMINEVLNELINFANSNENIRGFILQGSTVNDNVKEDIFSDLDPLFYVKDTSVFTDNDEWFNTFGKPIAFFKDEFKQYQDKESSFTRLVLYEDSFKIDFGFAPLSHIENANDMSLYKIVIDKDNVIPLPLTKTEERFYVKAPTNEIYQKAISEFLFDTSYIVKSLYRNEIFFNQFMFNILNEKIEVLLNIYLGIKYDLKVNPGSKGRYYERYLDKETWQLLLKTYSGSDILESIEALNASMKLIKYLGEYISEKLCYPFPLAQFQDISFYLEDKIRLIKAKHNLK